MLQPHVYTGIGLPYLILVCSNIGAAKKIITAREGASN